MPCQYGVCVAISLEHVVKVVAACVRLYLSDGGMYPAVLCNGMILEWFHDVAREL
jgi:hypothetical protein